MPRSGGSDSAQYAIVGFTMCIGGLRSALKFTDNTLRINDLYDGELYLPESGHLILPAEALGDDSKEDANGFSPVNWATPKYPTNLPFGKYISIYPI